MKKKQLNFTNHFEGEETSLEGYFQMNQKNILENFKDELVFDAIQYLAFLSLSKEKQEKFDKKNLIKKLEETQCELSTDGTERSFKSIIDECSGSVSKGELVDYFDKKPIKLDDFIANNILFFYDKDGVRIKKGKVNKVQHAANIVVAKKSLYEHLERYKKIRSLIRKVKKLVTTADKKVGTKVKNTIDKTSPYDVPKELFQQRTPRTGRVLISIKTVIDSNLTIDELNYFRGGVVVEFVNDDYVKYSTNDENSVVVKELLKRIGSDENVSSMISFRSTDGKSSGANAKKSYEEFLNYWRENPIKVNNLDVEPQFDDASNLDLNLYRIIRKDNIEDEDSVFFGNEKWTGFLFVSIKGGNKKTISSHTFRKEENNKGYLFNPAREYANGEVCQEILLVLLYFVLHSFDESFKDEQRSLINEIREVLSEISYEENGKTMTLEEYCINISGCIVDDKLVDPLTKEKINYLDFSYELGQIANISIGDSYEIGWDRSMDVSHNESAKFQKFYVNTNLNRILTAARPTNLFWSFHTSNMMQQNFTIDQLLEVIRHLSNK